MGLGQGVQPILGYCVGAKTWKRFKEVFKFTIIFALILGTVLAAICYVLINQIVSAFLTDQTAFSYAVQFARILLSTSYLENGQILYCPLSKYLTAKQYLYLT